MTASQPWWAIPTFTLAGVVISQAFTLLNEWLKRRAARADRWDQDKSDAYLEYQAAAQQVMRLRVWSVEAAGLPEPIEPVLTAVFRLNERVNALSPGRVSVAANEVAAAAHRLTRTIAGIRRETGRGTGGAISDDWVEGYETDRGALGAALNQFAASWRTELGITAPYLASWEAY